ncbi:hypothetical protein CEUSTIGMA_g5762.t1 [Chlamydomonas eustigma]|uniref:Ribosomal protein S11 n=1 Tax=Chlamydomonas eustigma TaxID=1157962 RepID=A0A250X6C4_9CHLO|nr:hypothetical protein CEUSTIGMA_g5762.t1 [Chlamydomonas eustigma]|eukprot:GAX78320.1 hypothetical protein CEUSTIGMA_g5762.t1 [Chlamydomonas eustigma]
MSAINILLRGLLKPLSSSTLAPISHSSFSSVFYIPSFHYVPTLQLTTASTSAAENGESSTSIAPSSVPVSTSQTPPVGLFTSGARKVVRLKGRPAAGSLHGIVHVYNSSNNVILSLTDSVGAVKAWTSAGSVGFKNARKSLPVAAEKAAEELAQKAIKLGYSSAEVKLKGVGNNKQYVVQSLGASGLKLTKLMDVTPIPYNGCRRPKKRRI